MFIISLYTDLAPPPTYNHCVGTQNSQNIFVIFEYSYKIGCAFNLKAESYIACKANQSWIVIAIAKPLALSASVHSAGRIRSTTSATLMSPTDCKCGPMIL